MPDLPTGARTNVLLPKKRIYHKKEITMYQNLTLKAESLRLKALCFLGDPKNARRLDFITLGFLGFIGVFFFTEAAHAFTAPAATDFAYTIYDIGVNKILKGPIGFVGGVAAMVLGAMMAIQQKIPMAIPCILGGAVLLGADTLVTSLGMTF